MALPPTLWPARLMDQSFGMCITPEDFIFPFYNANTNYYRPWKWCLQNAVKDFGSKVDNKRDSFTVSLDVQHFRPNEVSVKVANDQILVEGRHEERKDEHGFIARQFTRRYALPRNCKQEDVTSSLSSDGILTVTARKSGEELKKEERVVPIKLCKSCPMMEQVRNKNETCNIQKDRNEEIKNVDAAKTNTQIMLKEDHCCLLLKPELLKDASASSETISEKKKVKEVGKLNAVEQTSKNTSEILEETLSKSSAVAAAGISEQTLIDKKSTAISTSAEMLEQTCAKSTASVAKSSKEIGQTCMATSQMSELATSSMASASMESSSYKSSMTSSIKEIGDDLSDFVSDILCYELDTEDTKEFKKQL